jgi:hypothetical protein
MANIRLKTITIEPLQNLLIQNGNVVVNNTSISNSMLSGSFISNGGIGINTDFNSTSSTSGGALTVGGGGAIMKNFFIGGNLHLDSSSSTFEVHGISEKRLFLDNNKFYLSPDGVNKRFQIEDSGISINITSPSINSTIGALYIKGGISISCQNNSENASSGGALTVAGGISVGENINVAKLISVGETYSGNNALHINYTGSDQLTFSNSSGSSYSSLNMFRDDLIIYNSTGNIYINDNSLFSKDNIVFSVLTNISDTTPSINSSTASFVLSGGLSISNSTDSISSSCGGSFTTLGGVSIAKKLITGDSVLIDTQNTNKSNKLILYQLEEEFSCIGNTNGNSLVYKTSNTSGNHIFYANDNEVFCVKGTNEVVFTGKNQKYSIIGGGKNDNSLSFKSSNNESSIGFFTNLGNNTQNNDICIYNVGLPEDVNTSEYLKIGWDNNNNKYVFSSQISGSGNFHNISLESGISNQILLKPDGSTHLYSDIVSSNSNTAALVLKYGGLSINCTTDSIDYENGGGLTIAGGAAITKNLILGTGLDINGSYLTKNTNSTYSSLQLSNRENKYTGLKMFSSTGNLSSYPFHFTLYSLDTDNLNDNFECFQILHTNTDGNYIISTDNKGVGNKKGVVIRSNEDNLDQFIVHTSGNVGVNLPTPKFNLDINGTLHTNDIVYFSNTNTSEGCSVGSFIIDGGLSISNTNPAISSTRGGGLTVAGGIGIGSNMIVEGIVQFLNTTASTSYLEGSVIMNGGLSIGLGENASAVGNGGSLTVLGGGSFSEDLYVGGSINGSGSSSSTYAYLTLTATDEAINLSTGSFITFGGITIQSNENAINISNGGSILTPGGASIGKDVYIGGTNYINGMSNYYGNKKSIEELINFYDDFSVKRFSIDKAKVSHDFSITRYNSLGSPIEKSIIINNDNGYITFNNDIPSTSIQNASLVLNGGLSIKNTNEAISISNGGSMTIAGGVSVSKNVFIGGNIVLSSTTPSNNTTTGALLISGGVGIAGNINIAGNTLINGNLVVNGTTTSIDTTNTVIKDNVLVLNSGPSGSTDSGFVIQRYQLDNNNGLGDVISDNPPATFTLPDQSGMTNTQIKLSTFANSLDNFYTGHWIKIVSGFSSNQVRQITSYNGTTKIASVSSAWLSQNPSIGDSVSIYNKPYVGLIFNETTNVFEFGSTNKDASQNVSFTDYLPILFSNATNVSTQPSTNASSGSFVLSGGISISNDTDATSVTSGGTFTTLGGASISKKLFVGNKLYVNGSDMTPHPYDMFSSITFTAQNNQFAFTDITGLVFDSSVWSFDIYFSVRILFITSGNMYSNFHIRGVNKINTWEIIKTYVGDDTGIQFNITNFGQIQYTTPNFSNIDSITFKWRALVN